MNRLPRLLPLLLPVLLLTVACTAVDYRSPRFTELTEGHRTVAVLPFEMVFSGKAPPGLTGPQIAHIEEGESLAFQTSLYLRLLNQAGKGRIGIEIQPVEQTRRILGDHRIGVRESWGMETEDLARILGVDAVVRTRVEKTRYLSDLASFGIDVGAHVLEEILHDGDGDVHHGLPWGLTRTHDIFADGSLLSGRDGDLLWRVAVYRETDWSRPANDVIEGLTKKLARKFPYQS
ncbi:MAG: hypothetical protein GY719_28810 [bacterium]|nr:hypothetical protein [bacterium]